MDNKHILEKIEHIYTERKDESLEIHGVSSMRIRKRQLVALYLELRAEGARNTVILLEANCHLESQDVVLKSKALDKFNEKHYFKRLWQVFCNKKVGAINNE